MYFEGFDYTPQTNLGPSNGTTAEALIALEEQDVVLTTELTTLLPEIHRRLAKAVGREEINESLERSLKDNADVWTALSEY
jgi:hypothetical protein